MNFVIAFFISFFGMFIIMPIFFGIARIIGLYTIVNEGACKVFVLFGKVVGVVDEPGIHILPMRIGPAAFLVNWLGNCYTLDMRLDQEYLRSQPVNSEEGAPMGIGIWYEMFISDPVAYLFRNTDPRGSLRANVSNATVRCLSNMALEEMLESRHKMSQTVREEVTEKSNDWGYRLGSVYIRKVHFRDFEMIRQIEEKVVNRLRQVTSAIKQDGANQVSIITSTAERTAAIEFAKAAAMRPYIVGTALQRIAEDEEVEEAMFEILETQRMLESNVQVTFIPKGAGAMIPFLVSETHEAATAAKSSAPAPRQSPLTPPSPPPLQ